MGHEVPWGPVGVLVQDVSGPFLSKCSVPLRYEGSHPDGVPSLHRVPPFAEPVDALALKQEQAVLVVVDLFDVQELAGLKVHNVDVEVVLLLLGEALLQLEDLTGRHQVLRVASAEGGGVVRRVRRGVSRGVGDALTGFSSVFPWWNAGTVSEA